MFKSIMVGIGTVVAIVAFIATIIVAGNVAYAATGDEGLALLATLATILISLLGIWAGLAHYGKK